MSNLPDIMVDIETLDTTTNAVILSIGAVFFDELTGELGDEFYINVNPSSQSWRISNPNTIAWWERQGQAAQDRLTKDPVVSLCEAIVMLKKFVGYRAKMWSNGPTFDEMILRSAFDQLSVEFPIGYHGSRCCRTNFALAARLGVKKVTSKLKHDALSDAIAQAKTVMAVSAKVDELMGVTRV